MKSTPLPRRGAFSMKFRIHIAVVMVLALLINSVCLCAGGGPKCAATSCSAHEHHSTCPAHERHNRSRGNHECCQNAACSNPSEIGADRDSVAANHFPATAPVVVRAPILDLAEAATILLPTTEAHSPPVAVPVFLAIRSLLL